MNSFSQAMIMSENSLTPRLNYKKSNMEHAFICVIINLTNERMSVNNRSWGRYLQNVKHLFQYYSIPSLVYECGFEQVTSFLLAPTHKELLVMLKERKRSE